MSGVSVIICCYNGASRILETLRFLVSQKINDKLQWEIIVIDNASTDDTHNIVREFIKHTSSSINFRLIREDLPGLINARKKGIENAKYDILIFCDDDNHFECDYIEQAFNLMIDKPEVAIAGGWCKPKLPFYPGKWIEANYGALAVGAKAKQSGYVDWVFGAGMVVRKEIFEELRLRGISLLLTGRLGAKQTSGDDAELCQLGRFIGHKVYYSQDLVLHHKISAHRLTRWNFVKVNYRNVYMVAYFYLLHKLINNRMERPSKLYLGFLATRIKQATFFLPRMILGNNNFYCFVMFFQNAQLFFWLFFRRKEFFETYKSVRMNLYHGSE
jgi:glycosyltransferase involved in cell wall biosynthesis